MLKRVPDVGKRRGRNVIVVFMLHCGRVWFRWVIPKAKRDADACVNRLSKRAKWAGDWRGKFVQAAVHPFAAIAGKNGTLKV
jgi:hypothetical protein